MLCRRLAGSYEQNSSPRAINRQYQSRLWPKPTTMVRRSLGEAPPAEKISLAIEPLDIAAEGHASTGEITGDRLERQSHGCQVIASDRADQPVALTLDRIRPGLIERFPSRQISGNFLRYEASHFDFDGLHGSEARAARVVDHCHARVDRMRSPGEEGEHSPRVLRALGLPNFAAVEANHGIAADDDAAGMGMGHRLRFSVGKGQNFFFDGTAWGNDLGEVRRDHLERNSEQAEDFAPARRCRGE